MDTLIKALKVRGHKVIVKEGCGHVGTAVVLDDQIDFAIEEHLSRKERELTREEKQELKRYPGSYINQRHTYSPSGRLSLKIKNVYGRGIRKSWSDGKRQRIEDFLNQFIISLLKMAIRIKEDKIEAERRELERIEEQKFYYERAELYRKEKDKYGALEKEVDLWHKSQKIRNYINHIRRNIEISREISPGSELGQWLVWAAKIVPDNLFAFPPSLEVSHRRIA